MGRDVQSEQTVRRKKKQQSEKICHMVAHEWLRVLFGEITEEVSKPTGSACQGNASVLALLDTTLWAGQVRKVL